VVDVPVDAVGDKGVPVNDGLAFVANGVRFTPPIPTPNAVATNCVVAICVLFVMVGAVGAVGVPENAGLIF
jgi:hypothetical protein